MNKAVKRRGFTVVELVIVIAVIAVLATVLIPAFGNAVEKARESAAVQEAAGAYTEYLIESAAGGTTAEYVFYKTENKVVVLKNGASMGVYETDEEALKAAFDDTETSEDESAGCTLSALGINGLYFMQGSVQTGCVHSYESVVTPPTCQSGGYTTHTCTLCGDEYTDSETPATGEHYYENRKCVVCEIDATTAIQIGNPKQASWLFNLIATNNLNIYEVDIVPKNGNGTSYECQFAYIPNQLVTNLIPKVQNLIDSKNITGIVLNADGNMKCLTEKREAEKETLIYSGYGTKYTLTLDFNSMTWSIEEIE